MAGVAAQHVRLSNITASLRSLPYILQNISIALHAKMKGVPWTVDHDLTIADELVIGIGTAELSGSRLEERQRFVGITSVRCQQPAGRAAAIWSARNRLQPPGKAGRRWVHETATT